MDHEDLKFKDYKFSKSLDILLDIKDMNKKMLKPNFLTKIDPKFIPNIDHLDIKFNFLFGVKHNYILRKDFTVVKCCPIIPFKYLIKYKPQIMEKIRKSDDGYHIDPRNFENNYMGRFISYTMTFHGGMFNYGEKFSQNKQKYIIDVPEYLPFINDDMFKIMNAYRTYWEETGVLVKNDEK